MKIGLIIYGSLNTITGGYIYDHILVNYLRTQGVIVRVFSQEKRTSWEVFKNNFSQKMVQDILAFAPDLLLEDELNFASLFILNKRLKKRGFPIISIIHLLQAQIEKNYFIRFITKKIEYWYLNSVDGYIFNSLATQKSIEALIGKKDNHLVAYPGKDRVRIDQVKSFSSSYENKPLQIIFMGNLFYNKGLHVLLKAVASLEKTQWRLSVIGGMDCDLKYTQEIQQLIHNLKIKSNVTFHGYLQPSSLKDILKEHDLLAVPSYYESYGIVYAEAMGAGLPIIASNAGGACEIVKHEMNGFLIAPGDSEALKNCIYKFINNRLLLTEMGLASLNFYKDLPTWEQSMKKIYLFLHQNIKSSP